MELQWGWVGVCVIFTQERDRMVPVVGGVGRSRSPRLSLSRIWLSGAVRTRTAATRFPEEPLSVGAGDGQQPPLIEVAQQHGFIQHSFSCEPIAPRLSRRISFHRMVLA